MAGIDFIRGTRYELPPGENPSWYEDVLGVLRRDGMGDLRIVIEQRGGGSVSGPLHSTDEGTTHDNYGNVYLENPVDDDSLQQVPCEDIAAFTLLPEAPLDRSDELRG